MADGKATLDGGDGADRIDVYDYNVSTVSGGTGDDQIHVSNNIWATPNPGKNSIASISGGEGNDNISVSTHKTALLQGDAGDDQLSTDRVQFSTLNGGAGSDVLDASIRNNYTQYTSGDHSAAFRLFLMAGKATTH
jgi:Ca2+-binding RTX toxin-like protein